MKKTPTKKLSLSKQSLRTLSNTDLANAAGMTGDFCLLTPSCHFICTKLW